MKLPRLLFCVMKSRLVSSLQTRGVYRLNDFTKFGNLSRRTLSSAEHTPDTAAVFDSVVTSRTFTKSFQKDKHVDPALIEKLLRLSQLAPSSFNLQPYKMILVQQQSMKEALADTMLGGNGQRVLEAPLTIVYLSDRGECCIPNMFLQIEAELNSHVSNVLIFLNLILTEPIRLAKDLIALEASAGTDPGYLRDLSGKISLLLGNGGWVSGKLRTFATHLRSAIEPSPVVASDPTPWSVKNTIFACQTFLLAANAHGLSTAPMEGFDERRLCYTLGIPMNRYTVPMVICVGYAAPLKEGSVVEEHSEKSKRRYKLEDICFTEKFNNPWTAPASSSAAKK